jgi:hypothetical protein
MYYYVVLSGVLDLVLDCRDRTTNCPRRTVTGPRDVGSTGCKSSSRYTGILIWLIFESSDGI